MGDTNPENHEKFEISEEQWAEEVAELDKVFAARQTYVDITWLFGRLLSRTYRLQVHDKALHLLLPPPSRGAEPDGYIQIFLPKPYRGQYLKRTSESGDVLLTMKYAVGPPDHILDWSIVHLSTSLEFLELATSEAAPKTQ